MHGTKTLRDSTGNFVYTLHQKSPYHASSVWRNCICVLRLNEWMNGWLAGWLGFHFRTSFLNVVSLECPRSFKLEIFHGLSNISWFRSRDQLVLAVMLDELHILHLTTWRRGQIQCPRTSARDEERCPKCRSFPLQQTSAESSSLLLPRSLVTTWFFKLLTRLKLF
jgi:hypothetical protein